MYRQRLRYLRVANGLTQQQVADTLKIHRTTYAFYETGRSKPDIEMLLALSRIFGVTVDFILNGYVGEKAQFNDNPSRYEASEYPEYLSKLSDDEKILVMTYRTLNRKKEAMRQIRELYLEELSEDEPPAEE